jgi:hypothetical protein
MVITFPVRFPTIYVCNYKRGPSVLSAQKKRGEKERKIYGDVVDCPIINNCPSIALLAFGRQLCLW